VTGKRVRAGLAANWGDELRQAEVDHLGVTLFGEHHVGRLEIAMDDALGVCARQRLSDLSGDIQRPGRSQRLRFDRGAEFADPCRRG
jgi:hypothetical protein